MTTDAPVERYGRIAREIGEDPNYACSVAMLVLALHENNGADGPSRRALVGELIVGLRAGLREIAISDVSDDKIDDLCGAC